MSMETKPSEEALSTERRRLRKRLERQCLLWFFLKAVGVWGVFVAPGLFDKDLSSPNGLLLIGTSVLLITVITWLQWRAYRSTHPMQAE
jgi:hypothetical protein